MKALLTALAFSLAAVTAAQAAPAPLQGAARTEALTLAKNVLNQARSVRGRFVQISPDGSSGQGSFFLQRPGKLRFEYDPPQTVTIISNGSLLSVADRALKTDERYPLGTTPLYFVLKRDVDLDKDGKVTNVTRDGDALFVTVRGRKGQTEGSITLAFDEPSRELRQWRVVDGEGQVTQVMLSNIQSVPTLDPQLFALAPRPETLGKPR